MPECYYSGTVSDEVVMSSASVTKHAMETHGVTHQETPNSLVYNEVNKSDMERQAGEASPRGRVSVWPQDQYDKEMFQVMSHTVILLLNVQLLPTYFNFSTTILYLFLVTTV